MLYNLSVKRPTIVDLPGYVTVGGAADRLRLHPRSVRDLIYTGRLPSARLGRRHLLRIPDVEAERRRRLGLPLPPARPAARRRYVSCQVPERRPSPPLVGGGVTIRPRAARSVISEARRQRAQQRAAELERWVRSGHGPGTPRLPFTTVDLGAASAACDACGRSVRAGGRVVDAGPADGRPAARLCLTCARRTLLAWSDSRRREAVAARRLAQQLGTTYAPLLDPARAAA
jgi:excisionase family DNA binding protein